MKIKQLPRLLSAVVLSLSTLLTIGTPLVHAVVYTCVWTGATDLKFSTATNWTGCNSVAPQPGDIISFGPQTPVAPATLVDVALNNDLGNVALGGVILAPDTTQGKQTYYTYNTLKLAAGAFIQKSTSGSNVSFNETSTGSFTAVGDLSINGTSFYGTAVTIGGNVTMTGNIGFYASTGSITGSLTIGDQQYSTLTTGLTIGSLIVQKGGYVTFSPGTNATPTYSTPLTLGGGAGTNKPVISFQSLCDQSSGARGGCVALASTWTLSSPVILNSDAAIYAEDKVTVNFSGSLNGAAYILTNDVNSTGTINLNPSPNNSKTVSGIQRNPATAVKVTDDQSGKFFSVVDNETLTVDGKAGNVYLAKGATLNGVDGQINGLFAIAGSTLAPGHSPGCITSIADVTIFGTYLADIGGTTPCSGYDQMKVTGKVTLSDTTGTDAGTLQTNLFNGYAPKVGESYTIIENDGTDVVVGTFAGIAEGGTYKNQGVTYSVTYKGGEGSNDVVLTVTAVDAAALPAKPNTGFLLVSAHPMVSLGVSVLAAGMLYGASRRMKTARR